jgi:MFS family permease
MYVNSPCKNKMLTLLYKDFSNGCVDAKTHAKIICPPLKGLINSSYQLGSVFGVPFAPWLSQKFGRRWSIMGGSIIMMIGAIIQGFARNGKSDRHEPIEN